MSREMKHSGIAWIGEIPKEWKVCLTSMLFHEHKEKNFGLKETNLLSLSYGAIKRKDINTNEGLLPQSFVTYNVIKKGDIIFRLTDLQNDKRSLRTGLCKENGIITSAYVTLRANKKLHSAYFHYLFHSYDICKVFYGLGDGVRQGMNWEDVRKVMIFHPSLSEQQKIADYLDKVCGEVDDLVALQETMIEELKAYKQSVITEAVTKGLNPNAPMKDSGIDWIGEVPEGWCISKIKMIAKTNSGSTPRNISNLDSSNIVWVRTTDINDDVVYDSSIHLTQEEFSSASCPMLDRGTCVVAMYGGGGTIGKSGYLDVRATINQALCSMEVCDSYHDKYLFCVLKAVRYYWMKYAVGTRKDPNISQEIVRNMFVPIPPLSEQQSIASYLDTKCAEIDALIAIKQAKIEELKEYKKSIIYEYVTGKKEVV